MQTWQLDMGADGTARQPLTASKAGQYRLSYRLTDKNSPLPPGEGQGVRAEAEGTTAHTIEGGYLFTIVGEGFDGSQFRFNHLELIPDKREYAPGETVNLQINTDRTGGTVLLFTRPANGIYLPPKVIRLDGKSTLQQIGVAKKDMPNFFVEAVTIADGKVYTEAKEIVVPPEKRILNVEIQPSKEAYKPGEKAKVKLKLTDFSGEPFVGSTVVAIYDKCARIHFRRLERARDQRVLLELAPPAFPANRIQFATLVPESRSTQDGRDGRPGRLRQPAGDAGNGAARRASRRFVGSVVRGKRRDGATARSGHRSGSSCADGGRPNGGREGPDRRVRRRRLACRRHATVEPAIRTNFADTALWVGALTTEKDGTAEVSLDMPENLTTWRIKVWGMGHGTKVGQGFADVVTRKDLIVRLEAPRFFVQTDEVVLSAVVHNYLKTRKTAQVALELGERSAAGTTERLAAAGTAAHGPLALLDGQKLAQSVAIDSNGEARVDWRVKVLDEGEAIVRMKALTDEESDAMEQKFPCYIHGMLKTDSYSGAIRPKEESGRFTIDVPKDRRPKQSRLEVRYSPTLAGAMVDALPYLVDYPYGCTEQTLNRFLPTVITQKVLLGHEARISRTFKRSGRISTPRKSATTPIGRSSGNALTLAPGPAATRCSMRTRSARW